MWFIHKIWKHSRNSALHGAKQIGSSNIRWIHRVGQHIRAKCFWSFIDRSWDAWASIWYDETGIVYYELLQPRRIMDCECYKYESIWTKYWKKNVQNIPKFTARLFLNMQIFTRMGQTSKKISEAHCCDMVTHPL